MSRKIPRRKVLKGLGVAGVTGLAGCAQAGDETPTDGEDAAAGGDGGSTPTPTPTATPGSGGGMETTAGAGGGSVESRSIKMGILMGVTGGLSELGPPIRNAAQVSATYMDEQSDTFTIETQFEDTATDPNTGISGAEALVNAGYPMICGALSSTVTIQVAKNVTIPNGVVQCSPASTSPAITGLQDQNYVWRTPPTDALQSEVMVQIGRQRLGAKTTSILALNNAYGQGLAEAYEKAWKASGGTVQQRVSFEPGQGSYTSELSKALQDQPGLLMVVGYPESGVQIFRDFYADYSQDFCDIIVPDGLKSSSLPGNVGNSMRNVWGTAPLAAGPGKEKFNSLYKAEYGSQPKTPFMTQSFDAAAVLALANAAAGQNKGSAIRDQMMAVANPGGETVTPETLPEGLKMAASGTDIQYKGASSAVDFDENGDMKAVTYELYRYEKGGLSQVDTIKFKKS